ncbi:MAG TPA: hypothetical protein VKR58_03140, partial [Aquella sp.]|nr:hypothetical protein [Aquella sp.]
MKIFKIKNYLFCLISGVIFMNAAQAAYSEVGRCIFADYVYYQKVPREVIAWTVDDNMIDPKVEVRLESFGGFKTVPRDQRKLVLDRFSNKYKLTSLTIKGIIPRPHNRMKIPTRNVDATWTLKVAKRKDDTNITMEDWVLDRTCKAKIELYCIVNGDGIDPSKAILPNMMANFGTVSEDDNDGPEACPEGPLVTIHTPGEGEKPVPKSEETEMKTPPGFKKFLCKDKTDISIEGNIAFPM